MDPKHDPEAQPDLGSAFVSRRELPDGYTSSILRLKVNFKSRGIFVAGNNLSIGAVARQAGLRASALRFYEREGLLPRAARSGGKRIYADSILERLEVIEFAKECGFRLEEIRRLLHGAPGERVSARWQTLVREKLEELKAQQERIAVMQSLLERAGKCRCLDVSECGRNLLARRYEAGTL